MLAEAFYIGNIRFILERGDKYRIWKEITTSPLWEESLGKNAFGPTSKERKASRDTVIHDE